MAGGNIVKYVIIAVCLALAVGLFMFFSQEEEPAAAPDAHPKQLVCTGCGHHYEMSFEEWKQADALAQPAPTGEREEGQPMTRHSLRRPKLLQCPECGETSAVVASHCQEHDKYFPMTDLDGSRGRCPDCP